MRPPLVRSSLACGLLLLATPVHALRVMTYNILNYSGGRTTELRTVLLETQPDVLVVQEILSQSAVDNFLSDVLDVVNPGEWVAGDFVNGSDTDNGLYYRDDLVTYVGHHVVSTALRDIDEWTIRPRSHFSSGADLRLYTLHLKASQGSTNEQKRKDEVTAMRTRMETFPAGRSYAVLGDFNIYRSTEPAYIYMTSPANGLAGVVQDPIQREGNWHVNPSFADVHTQSPRTTQFGGGANGGMDDRFDLILVSPADQDGEGIDILSSTYTAFGQDGMHFDGALNVAPFNVVTQAVAQALHDASDHLPVYAEYQMPARILVASSLDVGTVIVGGSESATLSVENVTPAPADELDYSFAAPPGFLAPAGSFQAQPEAGPSFHSIELEAESAGFQAGSLTITTDDPDDPTAAVLLTGTVLDHAAPSVDGGTLLLASSLDLGSVAPGDTLTGFVEAHNFGFDALTALLDVYAAQLTGDPRFFFLDGFLPSLVGGTPASYAIAFDALGAADGTHAATLTFATQDQFDLPGATSLDNLVWNLTVTVETGVSTPAIASAASTGFVFVAPNPFRTSSVLRFGVSSPSRVEIRVFDVHGRAVRTLVDRALTAGEHDVRWDGYDARGAVLAPGIYFVRLQAQGWTETRKLVRVR